MPDAASSSPRTPIAPRRASINAQTGGPTYADNGTFGFLPERIGRSQNGSAEGLNYATLFKNSSGSVTGYTQGLNLLGSPNLNTGTGQFA